MRQVFGRVIDLLCAELRALLDEIGMLAAPRDALLPKLISGEARVPDADRVLGRAV